MPPILSCSVELEEFADQVFKDIRSNEVQEPILDGFWIVRWGHVDWSISAIVDPRENLEGILRGDIGFDSASRCPSVELVSYYYQDKESAGAPPSRQTGQKQSTSPVQREADPGPPAFTGGPPGHLSQTRREN